MASAGRGGRSLPVRGAWIEIAGGSGGGWPLWSLPVRGAWIEMGGAVTAPLPIPRRSPCGERGLKLLAAGGSGWRLCRSPCGERGLKSLLYCACATNVVAPRAGSVD